jgi:hypothetical protein
MIGLSILHTYVRVLLELIYHSLENPRSNWVVVIGLELLGLACPGLGLGSCYVSYPVPRKRERSLHTCAQDVQITCIVTI